VLKAEYSAFEST